MISRRPCDQPWCQHPRSTVNPACLREAISGPPAAQETGASTRGRSASPVGEGEKGEVKRPFSFTKGEARCTFSLKRVKQVAPFQLERGKQVAPFLEADCTFF